LLQDFFKLYFFLKLFIFFPKKKIIMGSSCNKNINTVTGECSYQDWGNDQFYVTIDLTQHIRVRQLNWSGYKNSKLDTHTNSGASYNRRHLADLQQLQNRLEQIPDTVTGQKRTLEYVKKQVQYALALPEAERITFDQANAAYKFFK